MPPARPIDYNIRSGKVAYVLGESFTLFSLQ